VFKFFTTDIIEGLNCLHLETTSSSVINKCCFKASFLSFFFLSIYWDASYSLAFFCFVLISSWRYVKQDISLCTRFFVVVVLLVMVSRSLYLGL